MGGNNSNANRFPLPDNWTVTEFVCMVVPVPNDPQYIAMMRGLLDTLTWSRSFRLHPTEQAARQVADTWTAAFESSEITFQNCEAAMLLRQNPANVCQLQQSHDGGDTWTLAFDYSLCSQVITVPAPYPGSSTGQEDAAAAVIHNLFQELIVKVDCSSQTKQQYIDTATGYLRNFDPDYSQPIALGAVYDAACAMTETELEEFEQDCTFNDKFDQLEECANVEGLFDWLDCLNALLVEWLNETDIEIMEALNKAAAALSGNAYQLMASGGAGGGAGFDHTCQWIRRYKTTDSDWPQWVNGQPGTGYISEGDYVPGSGWSFSAWETNSTHFNRMVVLHLNVSGMNLEYIKVKASGTTGTPSYGGINYSIYDLQHAAYWTDESAEDNDTFDVELIGTGATESIMIGIAIDAKSTEAALAHSGFVYEIELRGTGTAPTGGV